MESPSLFACLLRHAMNNREEKKLLGWIPDSNSEFSRRSALNLKLWDKVQGCVQKSGSCSVALPAVSETLRSHTALSVSSPCSITRVSG